MGIEEKREQARELGVDVDGRWGEERLDAEIDAALAGESEQSDDTDDGEQDNTDEPEQLDEPEPEPEPETEQESEPEPAGQRIRNESRHRFVGAGLNMMPGESAEIPAHMLENRRAMSIINRQVAIGLMTWVG